MLVPENPSVGDAYSVVSEPDPAVLRAVERGYHVDPADEELVGVGGTRWFVFEAVGPGDGELVLFNCWRCDPEEPNDEQATGESAWTLTVSG